MGRIARNTSPQCETAAGGEDLSANALHGPDGTVFRGVFKQQGKVAVAQTTRGVGLAQSDSHRFGNQFGVSLKWIGIGKSLDDLEQDDGHRTEMAASGCDPAFDRNVEEALREQAGRGIGQRIDAGPVSIDITEGNRIQFGAKSFLGFLAFRTDGAELVFDKALNGSLFIELLSEPNAGNTSSQAQQAGNTGKNLLPERDGNKSCH